MKFFLGALMTLLSFNSVFSQVFSTTEGKVTFFSTTPMEDITAINTTAKSAINSATNSVLIKIKMTGFVFEKPLMQEHFNEKYVESEKYPEAVFIGNIVEKIDFKSNGAHPVTVKGKLNIHGVSIDRTITGTITIRDGVVSLKTAFQVKVADHKIKIPSVVVKNIADIVDVTADFTCKPHVK